MVAAGSEDVRPRNRAQVEVIVIPGLNGWGEGLCDPKRVCAIHVPSLKGILSRCGRKF